MKNSARHIGRFLLHGNWLTAIFLSLTVGASVYVWGGVVHHAKTEKLIAELSARGVHPVVTYNPASAPMQHHAGGGAPGVGDIIENAVGAEQATASYSEEAKAQERRKASIEWFTALSASVQGNTPLILGLVTAIFGYLKLRADSRREDMWKAEQAAKVPPPHFHKK